MATHAPLNHPPPRSPAPRREVHTSHLVHVILLVLLTLGALAYAGSLAVDRVVESRRVAAMMGPKARLAPLPTLDITLGGARKLDMQVSVVLAPKVKASAVLRYQDRIADRLFETVGAAEPERLTAPGSAQYLKNAVRDAVNREAGRGLITDVYIERMVVR